MTYTYKETVNRIVVWLDNARVGRLACRKVYMEEGDEEKQLEAEHYAGAYQAAYSQAMRFWAEVDDIPDADAQELADLRKRNEELEAMVADFQQFHSKQMNTILKLWKEIAELRQEAEKHEDTDA